MTNNENYIKYKDALYVPVVYNPDITELDSKSAYIVNDLFYIYRGANKLNKSHDDLEPGIYDAPASSEYRHMFVQPDDNERFMYEVDSNLLNFDIDAAVNAVKTNPNVVMVINDTGTVFSPEMNLDDNLLKRAIKEALLKKCIDIDQYKDRFAGKNEFHNFKQVMKKDGSLTYLIFERACDALGLEFDIIIRESEYDTIGKQLTEPIIVSSDQTFTV